MLDLILLISFVIGLVVGYQRGFVVQIIHMLGFIVAFMVSYVYYKPLAEKFVLWVPYSESHAAKGIAFSTKNIDLDLTFYNLLAFVLIFIAVKFALQIIASMFDFLKYLPVLGVIARLLGGALGIVEVYIMMFFILYVGYLLPIDFIQSFIQKSTIAKSMFEHTPILSEKVKNWWFVYKS
ncbi:MAG TPA: CvpA family protein [Sporosarcina sp.]|nr:CvpA family protein [Sporosarcina sp.]